MDFDLELFGCLPEETPHVQTVSEPQRALMATSGEGLPDEPPGISKPRCQERCLIE